MRSFLVLFLSFTFGTIYGESSPKSFNWGLADQNPGKQFVVDEKIWERTATNLLRGENEFNVLKKFGKPIEKFKRAVSGGGNTPRYSNKKTQAMN